jgi:hypothetical protein
MTLKKSETAHSWRDGSPVLASMDKMLQDEKPQNGKGLLWLDYTPWMKIGKRELVTVKITKDATLLMFGYHDAVEISVSSIMRCTLKGDAFKITQLNNSEVQKIFPVGSTDWAWHVTPLKSGIRQLILSVSTVTRTGKENVAKDIPVMEYEIDIKARPIYQTAQFFSKNWQWLIGSFVGSGIIFQILKAKS